jgi:hypothetical protein
MARTVQKSRKPAPKQPVASHKPATTSSTLLKARRAHCTTIREAWELTNATEAIPEAMHYPGELMYWDIEISQGVSELAKKMVLDDFTRVLTKRYD